MTRPYPGYPGDPAAPAAPPPPPSARRAPLPQFPSAEEPNAHPQYATTAAAYAVMPEYPPGAPPVYTMPLPENATPGGWQATEQAQGIGSPGLDADNPFQKPSRFARFKKYLKKPSREVLSRAAIAVVAAAVGWGIGAKPWQSSKSARPTAALSAKSKAAQKNGAQTTRKAKATQSSAAAGRTARAAAATQQPATRRVAAVAHKAAPSPARPTTPTTARSTSKLATNTKKPAPAVKPPTTAKAKPLARPQNTASKSATKALSKNKVKPIKSAAKPAPKQAP